MKTITVSAAVIIKEEGGIKKVFATQRGYGAYKDGWEFPGGKLEAGETPEECIVREIREELSAEVKAEKNLGTVEYDYPEFHLTMHCILCSVTGGELKLLEHEDSRWLSKEHLDEVDWLGADLLILGEVRKLL